MSIDGVVGFLFIALSVASLYLLVAVGQPLAALLTGGAMLWLAMLPDVDHRVPGIPHRGPTHSLLFAACGMVCSSDWVRWVGSTRLAGGTVFQPGYSGIPWIIPSLAVSAGDAQSGL